MNSRSLLSLALLVVSLAALMSCGTQKEPKILSRAADAIESMLTPKNLSGSMFSAAYPEGGPSRFVSFMFSDMGLAEWPPSEGFAAQDEVEAMRAVGHPLLPDGVAVVPLNPDLSRGAQIVVASDEAKGAVILKGYLNPGDKAALFREIKLPKVPPAPGVVELYRANLESGMSDQAF